jgi:hypothetical protein
MLRADLVPLSMVKAWLGIATSDSDPALSQMISQISQAVLNSLSRDVILPEIVTEYYDGNNRDRVLLRNWPVNSIISVGIDGTGVRSSPAMALGTTLSGGWVLDSTVGPPPDRMQSILLRGGAGPFSRGIQNIAVTYLAGYMVSGEVWVIPSSPYQITSYQPYGLWARDMGVLLAGAHMTAVPSAPSAGQYSVDPLTGIYTFSVADAGLSVAMSYGYVPADLAQVTMEWASERFRYRDRIGLQSKSLGGQETMSYSTKAIPDFVEQTLRNYRRVVPM